MSRISSFQEIKIFKQIDTVEAQNSVLEIEHENIGLLLFDTVKLDF